MRLIVTLIACLMAIVSLNMQAVLASPEYQALKMVNASSQIYVFAFSWTPEFCSTLVDAPGCLLPESYWGKYFTIHGLWPQYSAGGYPSFCTQEAFNEGAINAVGWNTMITYWPNVKYAIDNPQYTEFWNHEWTKHGTCSGLSQLNYFQTSITLAKTFKTPSIVTNNVGGSVSASSLRSAFGGSTMVALQCEGGNYLSGAYTCWDQSNGLPTSQITCPSDVQQEDTCTASTVMIKSFY